MNSQSVYRAIGSRIPRKALIIITAIDSGIMRARRVIALVSQMLIRVVITHSRY